MGFDVNKIIMESLDDVKKIVDYQTSSAREDIGELKDKIADKLTAMKVGLKGGLIHGGVESKEDVHAPAHDILRKVKDELKDHPGAYGAGAAAIAAGLGALALRKRMKKAS